MKKIIWALVCVSTSAFAQNKVEFKASIKNSTSDTLQVIGRGFEKVIIGTNGQFQSAFEVPAATVYGWKNGEVMSNIYLSDKFNLAMTADAKDVENSVKYTGAGSVENGIVADFMRDMAKVETALPTATDEEFQTLYKGFARYDELLKNPQLDAGFVKMMQPILKQTIPSLEYMFQQEKIVKQLNDKPATPFNYRNINGGHTSLADLKGKYVYIDAWATWCGPCIQEIPSMKKVEQQYHGKNIEFVSISFDKEKDFEKWKKMVADKKMGGIQLFADKDFESDFAQAFVINSIPRFILIDPNGIVLNANAPRPSDPELVTLLNKYVK